MDKSKIIISVNSFMPTGFIGWSELAIALLQKYSCKILTPIDFSKKEELLKFFEGTDHQLNDDVFIDRLDHTDSEITFLALEPASEKIIPSIFSGKVFGAICGAGNRNWEKQFEVLQERNVTGFLSEVLPDELSTNISNDDLEYFCAKALFLPPCLKNGKASKGNPTNETVIIKESKEESGKPSGSGSELKRVLPILEQIEGFQTIDFSHDTDFTLFNADCNKSKAVYNFLHYPQLNLFLKINRCSQTMLHKEQPFDSPLRNFLADYSLFEFESKDKLKQPSVRAQVLELLSKNKEETQGIPEEVLSQFSATNLLPKLEQKLKIGDIHNQVDRLDYLYKVTTWKSLKKSHVHLKKSPPSLWKSSYVDTFLHPACCSALESLFREKIEFAGCVYLNPSFAQKVLSLPNSVGVTHLFKELMEYDADKWIRACENSLTQNNAHRFAELLLYSCLLVGDKSIQNQRVQAAKALISNLIQHKGNLQLGVCSLYAKLKLFQGEYKLSKQDFPYVDEQMHLLIRVIYETSQEELFLSDFRKNAQTFLGQFIQLLYQPQDESHKNEFADTKGLARSHLWALVFCGAGRISEGFKIMQRLVESKRVHPRYLLEYLILGYFYTTKPQTIIPLAEKNR